MAPTNKQLTQPHIPIEVAPLADSKWDDAPPSKVGPAHGHAMIDTGAAVTLVSRKWAEAHGLPITPTSGVQIVGAGGSPVQVVGTTSMAVRLTRSLEVDVSNVTVSEGKTYQALFGMDLLNGRPGVLDPASLRLSSAGAGGTIRFRLAGSCDLTEATFITPAQTVGTVGAEALPPPPAMTADPNVP